MIMDYPDLTGGTGVSGLAFHHPVDDSDEVKQHKRKQWAAPKTTRRQWLP